MNTKFEPRWVRDTSVPRPTAIEHKRETQRTQGVVSYYESRPEHDHMPFGDMDRSNDLVGPFQRQEEYRLIATTLTLAFELEPILCPLFQEFVRSKLYRRVWSHAHHVERYAVVESSNTMFSVCLIDTVPVSFKLMRSPSRTLQLKKTTLNERMQ